MSKTSCLLRGLVMLVLFVTLIALAFLCSGPVDSAQGELDKFTYLPFVSKYPTSTPRPTVTPEPTVRPTLPPATAIFDPSTPISTQPWVTLFPPFPTPTAP